jgi:hypothetical protein
MAEGRLWSALEGTIYRKFVDVRLEQCVRDGMTKVAQCGTLVIRRNALKRYLMRFCKFTTLYLPCHFGGDGVLVQTLARAVTVSLLVGDYSRPCDV